jgi:hypothetical protein
MTTTTLLDSPLRNSWVFDTEARGAHPTARTSAAVAEFAAAVAGHEIQHECVEAIRRGAPLPTPDSSSRCTVERLLSVCSALIGDDPRSAASIATVSAFFEAKALDERRIVLDRDRLTRAVDALELAVANDNRAAFETLLRRALRLLVSPLLPA